MPIERAGLAEFLREQPARLYQRGSICGCPAAEYLAHTLEEFPLIAVRVNTHSIRWATSGLDANGDEAGTIEHVEVPPEWLVEFIQLVDQCGGPISGLAALALLDAIPSNRPSIRA